MQRTEEVTVTSEWLKDEFTVTYGLSTELTLV